MKESSSLNICCLITLILGLAVFLYIIPDAEAVGLDDQLRLIRGAFEDGLYDLVYPEAVNFLEKAGNHKARGEVYLILGFIEKRNHNLNKAQDYFNKATISDDPEIRLQGYYQAASAAWSKSDYLKAVDGFQAIVDENQGGRITEQSYYWLVLSLFESQQYDAVIQKVADIIAYDKGLDGEKLIRIMFCRAQSYFYTGSWNEAKSDLEMVYQADTGHLQGDAALTLARIYSGWDNLKMADAWATKRLISGYDRNALLIRISYALDNEDFVCAQQYLKVIANDVDLDSYDREWVNWKITACELEITKNTAHAWWLPLVDFCRNNLDSSFIDNALTEFLRLNELSPAPNEIIDFLIWCRRWDVTRHGMQIAQLYLTDKNYDSALYWILAYLNQNDDQTLDSNTRLLMARLLTASGDVQAGSDELLRLDIQGDVFSEDVDVILQQAELLYQSAMYQQAASLFQHLIVTPESSEAIRATALFRLGSAYFQMEQWVFAGDIYKRFIELYPDASRTQREQGLRRYAMSCVYAQNWQQAENAIGDYLTIFGETEYKGEMYYLRGLAEANQGKTEEALISMGSALDHLVEVEYIESVKNGIRQLKDFLSGMDELEH